MPNDLQMPIFLTSSSMSLLTRNKVNTAIIPARTTLTKDSAAPTI